MSAASLFESVVDTLHEPLLVLEADLRVQVASPSFCRTFRIAREEVEGCFLYDLDGGQWRVPGLMRLLEQVVPTGSVVEGFEVSHDFPRVGHCIMLLNARRMAPRADEPALILLAMQDITIRKQVEEERSRLIAELSRSNAELERFAYVASHDLQEPLRMVSSYTQLLARRYEGQLDEKADRYIRYAVDGATRMQVLINALLAYSRVGRRGETQPTDAALVLGQALDNLALAIRNSGATVTADPLPRVAAEPVELLQVLQNLLGNAIKFRSHEPPRVHVSARREGAAWLFSVSDNGIGIDPAYFERVFAVFQRLHSTAEYPGTGIGLAITRKIVERHGGRIWVESQPGRGSTFFFSLPAVEEP